MDRNVARAALLAALSVSTGCLTRYTASVAATPVAASDRLLAREPGCEIELFRLRQPEQPFDELAILRVEGPVMTGAEAVALLRARACEVGADAVVVTSDLATEAGASVMTGTAVAYREASRARAEAARVREAELAREAAARKAREEAERAAKAAWEKALRESRDPLVDPEPPGYAAARAAGSAAVRLIPDAAAAPIAALEAGTAYWAFQKVSRGHRRVRLRDGRTGFVAAAELELVTVEQLRAEMAARASAAGSAVAP